MSAAEKLRELDIDPSTDMGLNVNLLILRNALPELIAVVEAAEECRPSVYGMADYITVNALKPLHASLEALNTSLRAEPGGIVQDPLERKLGEK